MSTKEEEQPLKGKNYQSIKVDSGADDDTPIATDDGIRMKTFAKVMMYGSALFGVVLLIGIGLRDKSTANGVPDLLGSDPAATTRPRLTGYSCGSYKIKNLGTFDTPEECGVAASNDKECIGNEIMYSPRYSAGNANWGCRCCDNDAMPSGPDEQVYKENKNWNVYSVSTPTEAGIAGAYGGVTCSTILYDDDKRSYQDDHIMRCDTYSNGKCTLIYHLHYDLRYDVKAIKPLNCGCLYTLYYDAPFGDIESSKQWRNKDEVLNLEGFRATHETTYDLSGDWSNNVYMVQMNCEEVGIKVKDGYDSNGFKLNTHLYNDWDKTPSKWSDFADCC